MITMDVVVCFYRREKAFWKVAWGLERNREHINQVIVVNDEPWTEEQKAEVAKTTDLPLVFLGHTHDGYGVARSFNQGIRHAITPFVVCIADDVVIEPGSLEKMIPGLKGTRLLYGRLHQLEEDSSLEEPKFSKIDNKLAANLKEQPHLLCRHGYWICSPAAYFTMGGHDESFCESYGWEEYEFTLRWMIHFGMGSVTLAPAAAWHVGGVGAIRTERPGKGHHNYETMQERYWELCEKYPQVRGA